MPPKNETKREDLGLSAVVVVDSFDQRFYPFTQTIGPWCLQQLCNVPIIDYTLSWILRTEVKRVILVVTEKNAKFLVDVEKAWKHCFEALIIVPCKNSMSVGDSLREIDSRGLVPGDFILLSNPASITSSTLSMQIAKFRERRREDKNNVMTLIYSQLENTKNTVVAVEKSTNKLRLYHKEEDASQLDVDKPHFIEDAVIRRDIVDSGIALCSMNIPAQFTDNFDFRRRDDVIREILVNEEVLLHKIHIEVLPEEEAAISITDYDSLLMASTLLMERWFYPIVPDKMVIGRTYGCHVEAGNVYATIPENDVGRLSPQSGSSFDAFNVCIGFDTKIALSVDMCNATVGNRTAIGINSRINNCIIGDDCVIGADCHLVNAVIGHSVTIPDGTRLAEEAVISANVKYPGEFEYPVGCAISKQPPDEDDEDAIKNTSISGLNIWKLADGSSFWTVARKNEKHGSENGFMDDEMSGSESGSDGLDEVELDNVGQFYSEVVDSMQRIHEMTFAPEQMNSLIVELNSSKLAYNISMEDVTKHIFLAFLGLSGNDNVASIKGLIKKWKVLFTNYYQPHKSQIQILMAIEERHKENRASFGAAMVAKLVHALYIDDILEEEPILEWAESLPEDCDLREKMQPIIVWLKEDAESSDDD